MLTVHELSSETVRRIAGNLLTDTGIIRLDEAAADTGVPRAHLYWMAKAVMEMAERSGWSDVERALARFATGCYYFVLHHRTKVKGAEEHFAKAREHAAEVKLFERSLRLAFARMSCYLNAHGRDRKQAEEDAQTGINRAKETNCRYVGWAYVELAAARLTLGSQLSGDVEGLLERAEELLKNEPAREKSIIRRRLLEQQRRLSKVQAKEKMKGA